MEMVDLVTVIDQTGSDIRFESLDFTVGEIINLHAARELSIQPEFQRYFRWDIEQRSRLIESLMLGLPIPQIVLFQNKDGVLELIDGLQRISSLIHFIDHNLLTNNEPLENQSPLRLSGCDIAPDLNGNTYADLPGILRLELKRKPIRAVIIRRTNLEYLRYEMFKRLNSGGSPAEYQEVRNAQVRILGDAGKQFLDFLADCAQYQAFLDCTESISDASKERGGLQELVLRYLACKNYIDNYKGSVAEWLDSYIESLLIHRTKTIDYQAERKEFEKLFTVIQEKMGVDAFVKRKQGKPIGGLAPAYYEAVTLGTLLCLQKVESLDPDVVKAVVSATVEGLEFRKVTGPGANSQPKLKARIDLIVAAYENA